jgi:hypothetical protein
MSGPTVPTGMSQYFRGLALAELLQTLRRHPPWAARSGCYRQAVLVIRWHLDGTGLAQLAADNRIGGSTAYRYLHEGIVWSS